MKWFWILLLLATRAFAFSHIGSAVANLSYTSSAISFPYTTAQNASGNFFYVTVGIDASSASMPTAAAWNGQTASIIQLIGYFANSHDGIAVFQFSSPATITSSNVTITALGGMAYPAVTLDEFSGTSGMIGGVGYALGTATAESLTVSNLTITSASSVTFSAAVGRLSGATTQPAGWTLLENSLSSSGVITTSAWGVSVTGTIGVNPFTWTFADGYPVAVAFEMEVGPVPTATPALTPTPTITSTATVTPTPAPTPRPGWSIFNPFYIQIVTANTPTLTITPTPTPTATP